MGLDYVELILAVEDSFQIHIADEEANTLSTIGDLHKLVIAKLQGQNTNVCLTSAAFYRTRRGIVETLALDRRKIKPSTPLETILPLSSRRKAWQDIQVLMKLKLPDLEHSRSTQSTLLTIGIATALAPGLYARVGFLGLTVLFFTGLVLSALLIKFSPNLAVEFPNCDATVGDLAREVLAINHARLVDEVGGWNNKDVWDSLCRVIVIETSVAREEITPEARILGDLGID